MIIASIFSRFIYAKSILIISCMLGLLASVHADLTPNVINFGWADTDPVPGDYDGDGQEDFAFYDTVNYTWYIFQSTNMELRVERWGSAGALPQPGDYDGDGITDIALYCPSQDGLWMIMFSGGSGVVGQFGGIGYEPVPGDYNGDGSTDLGVYGIDTGTWYAYSLQNQCLLGPVSWGRPGASPVPGDYDGDGITDPAIYEENTAKWSITFSDGSAPLTDIIFGASNAIPVVDDYDLDGITDPAVYFEEYGLFYVYLSGTGQVEEYNFGLVACAPVPGSYSPPGSLSLNRLEYAVYDGIGNWYLAHSNPSDPIITSRDYYLTLQAVQRGIDAFPWIPPTQSTVRATSSRENGGANIVGENKGGIIEGLVGLGLEIFGIVYDVATDPTATIMAQLNQINITMALINEQLAALQQGQQILFNQIRFEGDKTRLNTIETHNDTYITDINNEFDNFRLDINSNKYALSTKAQRGVIVTNHINAITLGTGHGGRSTWNNVQTVYKNLVGYVDPDTALLRQYTQVLTDLITTRGQDVWSSYLILENYFGRILTIQAQGISLVVEVDLAQSNLVSAVEHVQTFQSWTASETAMFLDGVRLLISAGTDHSLYISCPDDQKRFLPPKTEEILSRAYFLAAQCSTNYVFGLNGQLVGEPYSVEQIVNQYRSQAKDVALQVVDYSTCAVFAMTKPYASAAAWMQYIPDGHGGHQVDATSQLGFGNFADTNMTTGETVITVEDVSQTVTMQWRSNDYVTVVSAGTPNAVPYAHCLFPLRHNPKISSYKGSMVKGSYLKHITGAAEANREGGLFQRVSMSTDPSTDQYWYEWQYNSNIILIKPRSMSGRLGVYGEAHMRWQSQKQESYVYYNIEVSGGNQGSKNIIEKHTYDGNATYYGKGSAACNLDDTQFLTVSTSIRGKAWKGISWVVDNYQVGVSDKLLLYMAP